MDGIPGLGGSRRQQPLCGTFGCILPNNHRGLHQLPTDDEGRRKRPKFDKAASVGNSKEMGAVDQTALGDDVDDKESDGRGYDMPGDDDDGDAVAEVQVERKVAGVHPKVKLCRKTPHCSRYFNHPGASRAAPLPPAHGAHTPCADAGTGCTRGAGACLVRAVPSRGLPAGRRGCRAAIGACDRAVSIAHSPRPAAGGFHCRSRAPCA